LDIKEKYMKNIKILIIMGLLGLVTVAGSGCGKANAETEGNSVANESISTESKSEKAESMPVSKKKTKRSDFKQEATLGTIGMIDLDENSAFPQAGFIETDDLVLGFDENKGELASCFFQNVCVSQYDAENIWHVEYSEDLDKIPSEMKGLSSIWDSFLNDGRMYNMHGEQKYEVIVDNTEKVFENKSLLNKKQLAIKENIENSDKKYFLLKGVTGSGKTEIYIELIKKAFFEGYGSIFLVPEISLTPQMVERFQSEFKNNIAILHSSLSDIERAKEWESIYTGEKKIVLGVRSAIFSPVKNLKYIILDEEHEATYKQDSSPRYNAKYVAIKRCLDEDAKLILGSATPSIESYYYAKTGIYELLSLEDRYGNAQMPDIQVVDMKQEDDLFFSKALLEEIKNTLLKNEQVILLLNRKGYSTYIQCKDCGYVEECDNCSIKMSYYKSTNKYKCNYCGKQIYYTGKCTKCGSTNLIHSGKGIERIEEELKKYFDVPIIKVDSELSRNKDYFSRIYKDFSDKKYSILIGTQIIAKGLHFPNVTLVGVINSDIILNFPDFRSGEKTFQLLTQVSGRAGRGDKKGKVIIQTYEPENNVIKDSKEENYDLFYEKEISSRKVFSYPPFSKILNIGFSSEDEARLLDISKKFYDEIKSQDIELYGPMPSMVYKVQKRFRMNIFAKGSKKKIDKFKLFLKRKLNEFNDTKVRIVVDIDPINMM